MNRGGASLFNRKFGPASKPAPVPEVATEGEVIVYQLADDDSLVKVDVATDAGHADKIMRLQCTGAAASVRDGTILRVRGGTTERQASAIRRALAKLHPDEPARRAKPEPPAEPSKGSLTIERVSVALEEEADEPESEEASPGSPPDAPTPCPIKGCTELRAPAREATHPALKALCRKDRKRALGAVYNGSTTEENAIAYLSEGKHCPSGKGPRASKAEKPSQSPKRSQKRPVVAKKPPRKPRPSQSASSSDPLVIVRRYASAVAALGGLEAAEQLAALVKRTGGVEALEALVDEVSALAAA